jgi:uncharacterized protein with FMN-binding domain
MRRGVFAVIGTIAGTTLLVGAKLGTAPPLDPNAVAAAGLPDDTAAASAPASGSPVASPSAVRTAAGPAPSRTTSRPAPTGGATRTAAPSPTAAGTGLKSGTFAGSGAAERYGTVTVTITVSGGRMTGVSAAYATSSSESRQISNAAFPTLRQEALTAQSARIATVSGATYTSNAYKVSLQSALDKAKA